MTRIKTYVFNAAVATWTGIPLGVLLGIAHMHMKLVDDDEWLSLATFATIAVAILCTVVLHEAVHSIVARSYGLRAKYGVKYIFAYVTFTEKMPRNTFLVIALAPLIILSPGLFLLYYLDVLRVFSWFCFVTNTFGAIGDIWMAANALRHPRKCIIQDTGVGFEIWEGE